MLYRNWARRHQNLLWTIAALGLAVWCWVSFGLVSTAHAAGPVRLRVYFGPAGTEGCGPTNYPSYVTAQNTLSTPLSLVTIGSPARYYWLETSFSAYEEKTYGTPICHAIPYTYNLGTWIGTDGPPYPDEDALGFFTPKVTEAGVTYAESVAYGPPSPPTAANFVALYPATIASADGQWVVSLIYNTLPWAVSQIELRVDDTTTYCSPNNVYEGTCQSDWIVGGGAHEWSAVISFSNWPTPVVLDPVVFEVGVGSTQLDTDNPLIQILGLAADDDAPAGGATVARWLTWLVIPSQNVLVASKIYLWAYLEQVAERWPVSWLTGTVGEVVAALDAPATELEGGVCGNPMTGAGLNPLCLAGFAQSFYGSWAGPALKMFVWLFAVEAYLTIAAHLIFGVSLHPPLKESSAGCSGESTTIVRVVRVSGRDEDDEDEDDLTI